MSVDDHLLRDEKILAGTKGYQRAKLYATNKRVLTYKKELLGGEKVDSLYYSHITSASLRTKSYIWLAILGVIIIIIGVMIWAQVGPLLFFIGAVLFLVGVFYKEAWYQLGVVGLSSKELKRWRTASAKEDAKTFARFIQDQISARELPTPPPMVIPITLAPPPTVPARMYCRYCGSEILADSVYCSKCGKRL